MNATATRLHVYVSGAVIFALNHNENENEIYSKHNAAFNASTGHGHTGATGDGPKLTANGLNLTTDYPWTGKHTFTNAPQLVPLGSIIPFYDFNGALTFDSTYWAYCNGQTKTIGGGSRTLPDLSGRYLVGFGTDGGADIGTASWDVTPVGNAGHTVNLQHSHIVSSHTHDLGNHTHTGASHTHDLGNHTHTGASHTHTGPSHTHGPGTLELLWAFYDTSLDRIGYSLSGGSTLLANINPRPTSGANTERVFNFSGAVDRAFVAIGDDPSSGGLTAASGTGNTGATTPGAGGTPSTNTSGATTPGAGSGPSSNTSGSATPGMDLQLSTTQSIQPRSIRARYIMRIL